MSTSHDIVVLPSVDSTNIYAMQEVHAHLSMHGRTYFALEQTAGRGQRGKQWLSTPGENIMMSRVYRMESHSPEKQFAFSASVALGCYDFYKTHAGDEVSVKWPNDIYWRDRKAGGILIENLLQGQEWKWAVAGMGLNVNQVQFDPAISRKPVSLKQITGRTFDLLDMVKSLCEHLERRWEQFVEHPLSIMPDYNEVLYLRGQTARLKKESRVFEARVEGVDGFGRLKLVSAVEELFHHGEVEFL